MRQIKKSASLSKPAESLALKFFPSGPPPTLPLVLSERYKRSSKAKFLVNARTGEKKDVISNLIDKEDDSDTADEAPARQGKQQGVGNATGDKKRKDSDDSNTGGATVQFDPSTAFAGSAEPRKEHKVAMARRMSIMPTGISTRAASAEPNEHTEAVSHHEEIPVEIYKPFALSERSSFNPEKLSPKKMSRLDAVTKAKYLAYALPAPQILEKITDTERRSQKVLKEQKQKISNIIHSAKKRWAILHHADDALFDRSSIEQGALNAQKRLESKLRRMAETREEELNFLVEGQLSSIDAIRLKEHLVIHRVKVKNQPQFTPKERLRLNELLS